MSDQDGFTLTAETHLAEDLEVVKRELRERSAREGQMTDLGTLSNGQHEHLWNRGEKAISLKRRIDAGEVSPHDVEEGVARLGSSFVPTTKGAPKRCVDGSTNEAYNDNDPRSYGRVLGPQIQGGTADEAVAMRLIEDTVGYESATLLTDMDIAAAHPSEYAPGGHTDNLANAEKSGCGAVDGQLRKLAMYSHPETAEIIEQVATTILDLAEGKPVPPTGVFATLQANAQKLATQANYFPAPQEFLAKLRSLNPNGVEKMIRPHAEISLTLNFVRGTTFHRDHFNAATNSKIQNFNLDVWAILDEHEPAVASVLVADAVATVMDLTDGSLRLFARLPQETPAA